MTIIAEEIKGKLNHSRSMNVALYDAAGNPIYAWNLGSYIQSDFDDNSTTKYYGFIDSNGNWYIRKEDWTDGTIRFVKGTSGYAENWTIRSTLSYSIFNGFY